LPYQRGVVYSCVANVRL